jgi:hypothetical protein
VLDADLQDPPELLPDMMRALDAGADVADGQRIEHDGELVQESCRSRFCRLLLRMTDVPIPPTPGAPSYSRVNFGSGNGFIANAISAATWCASRSISERLDRLALYYRRDLTELVERLAAAAEHAVEAKLTSQALAPDIPYARGWARLLKR